MTYFITTNVDDSINEIFNDDNSLEIPAGATPIEQDDFELMALSLYGHSTFDNIGGIVTFNQVRFDIANLSVLKNEKLNELKSEAVSRMGLQIPVSNFEEVELTREFWLSIDPAARQPTVAFQWVIDVYQAGKDASIIIKGLTDLASVNSYDVVTDPSWPA